MKLSSTIDHTLSPTLRAASVRLSHQVSAAPERIFDAWLNAGEARTFLFAGPIGDAIRSEIDARVGGGFRIVQHQDGKDIEYSANTSRSIDPTGSCSAYSSKSTRNEMTA